METINKLEGYVMNIQECGKCKNFKLDPGANVMGTCRKKLMTVISTMKVAFKKENGTCFEPLTPKP